MSLDKIAKLLSLAENAATEEEANAAFAKAQTLATLHAISLADVRSAAEKRVEKDVPIKKTITVGKKGKHINARLINLWSAIAGPNDVKINIAHNSTFVVLFGMTSDVEKCEQLFATIAPSMIKFAEDYLRTGEWRSETEWRAKKTYIKYDYPRYNWQGRYVQGEWEEEWGYYPVTKQSARASFLSGYTSRIESILHKARNEAMAEADEHFHAEAEEHAEQTGEVVETMTAELVLKPKQLVVEEFYDRKSTARGSWRGASSGGSSSARSAGRSAADRTRLSAQGSVGGGGRSISQ